MSETEEGAPCVLEPLVEGPDCFVELCSCGMVHVSVSNMTLRVEAQEFQSIAETIQEAVQALSSKSESGSSKRTGKTLVN